MPKSEGKELIRIYADPTTDKLAKSFRGNHTKLIGKGVKASGAKVMLALGKTTPKDTKALFESQKLSKVRGELEYQITENKWYGLAIRGGVPARKINPIFPVRAKALANRRKNFGPVAAVYNHPGIRKNDYFQKAIEMAQPQIDDESQKAAIEIAAKIADV